MTRPRCSARRRRPPRSCCLRAARRREAGGQSAPASRPSRRARAARARRDAAVHAAAPPAARRLRRPARDDLGQPERRADRHRQRRGARPARRHRRRLPACTTAPSTRATTTPCARVAGRAAPSSSAGRAGYAPFPLRLPFATRRGHPRVRTRAEEHLLPAHRRARVRLPAHRRHGERRDARELRAHDRALRAALPRRRRDRRLRPAPRVPLHASTRSRSGLPAHRRAAPPRAHRERDRRARRRATGCSASRSTAPATAPTARSGAARWLLADLAGFERVAHLRRCPDARRRRGDPPAGAHGTGVALARVRAARPPRCRAASLPTGSTTRNSRRARDGRAADQHARAPPRWAACSTPSPRSRACATTRSTRARPPSSSRRSPTSRREGAYAFGIARGRRRPPSSTARPVLEAVLDDLARRARARVDLDALPPAVVAAMVDGVAAARARSSASRTWRSRAACS